MIIIAIFGGVFGLARAIGWELVLLAVALVVFGSTTTYGFLLDRRSGGLGVLGGCLGGIVGGVGFGVLVIVVLLVTEEEVPIGVAGSLTLLFLGCGAGGLLGLIVGGIVSVALILSGVDPGIPSPHHRRRPDVAHSSTVLPARPGPTDAPP